MNSVSEKGREALKRREERKELKYIGVRRRSWGKWVSEIREPKKKRRIWLGSYDNPQMAARAYDVAALYLKGSSAILNFPHAVHTLPRPLSSASRDIQSAASRAARTFEPHGPLLFSALPSDGQVQALPGPEEEINTQVCSELSNVEFTMHSSEVDPLKDLLMQSPNMWMDMAEALLLTPPRPTYEFDDTDLLDPLYSIWTDSAI
ncbi:hypothetical protein SUGI_0906920 [Cryptomeria japonica]|nr:hypothetical protein SUGI_0906920 [Cryptomeria japonica]